jgi:hypothetical protein
VRGVIIRRDEDAISSHASIRRGDDVEPQFELNIRTIAVYHSGRDLVGWILFHEVAKRAEDRLSYPVLISLQIVIEKDAPINPARLKTGDASIYQFANEGKDWTQHAALGEIDSSRIHVLIRHDAAAAVNSASGVSLFLWTRRFRRVSFGIARDPGAGDEYVETVFRLNRFLNESGGNRRLRAILASLALQTLRYSRLGLSTPARRLQSVSNWQRLVRAVREGDGLEAQRAAEQRVTDSRDAAIAELEKRES